MLGKITKILQLLGSRGNYEYVADKRYTYNLIFVLPNGERHTRIYLTSSPLESGHRIVLAPQMVLVVTQIVHVTYTPATEQVLKRDTVFVHAGVTQAPESKTLNLLELGFSVIQEPIPYTIH